MVEQHFTATTYLLNSEKTKMLFLYHQKLNSWLPPGGHLHHNESPEDAARREIREEIGTTNFSFYQNEIPSIFDGRTYMMLQPHFLIKEEIEDNHYHMDFIYYASLPELVYVSPENATLRWFSLAQIRVEDHMFQNVKDLAVWGFENL